MTEAVQTPREKILVIKLSALGDVVMALGAMAAIRKHHPQAHITLMTTRPFRDIMQRSGYFDDIWLDTRPRFYALGDWFRLLKFMNSGGFSRVYDLQLNGRTGLYYRLCLKKPEWSGIVRGASHFYANPQWRQMHAFKRHKEMLAELGLEVTLPDLSWMSSDVTLLAPPKPYVLLVPGSAPQHPHKRWPAARYAALGLRLVREGYHVALLGTAAEREVIDKIKRACPDAHDLSGRTSLYDITTLARDAAGAVSNDTGPGHLIALSGCPIVSLFSGTTDPALSAPVGDAVTVIQSEDIGDITVEDVRQNFKPRGSA